jgi:aminoglycoside phosphotransferase (APT) family kinase protein
MIPTTHEAVLEPMWLESALSDVGEDERVVDAVAVDTSKTLAEKLRIAVTIETADGSRRVRGYCIKAHLDGASALDILPEARFYRDVAPRLRVRMPRTFFTAYDDDAQQAMIIMEDIVASGGVFGSPHHPQSVAVTRDTLSQLAVLHASTWGRSSIEDIEWLGRRIETFIAFYPADQLQSLLDDGRVDGAAAELRDAGNLVAALERVAEHAHTCLLHGDTHTGNVYLDAEGRACWFDWQVTQLGNWSTDVSYHLATVLSVEDRRTHEVELLQHYLRELAAQGAPTPSWDEAWDLYRRSFPYGYFLWVITRVRDRSEVLAHLPRLLAALADHDTYRLLGVV